MYKILRENVRVIGKAYVLRKIVESLSNHDDDASKNPTNLHICTGNHMILRAIWNKYARVNFSKTTKLHEPVGRVKFGVFEKFTSAYLFQIAQEKSCDYLLLLYIRITMKNMIGREHSINSQ